MSTPRPYSEVKSEIQPLDLIFFRGTDFISRTVATLEALAWGRDDYSHVGLVVTREVLPQLTALQSGTLYLWESTVPAPEDKIKDVIRQQPLSGVQIRPLEEVLYNYHSIQKGQVFWNQLPNNPWCPREGDLPFELDQRRAQVRTTLQELYFQVGVADYEVNPLYLLTSVFPRLEFLSQYLEHLFFQPYRRQVRSLHGYITGPTVQEYGHYPQCTPNWVFCSQMVTLIYQRLGILSSSLEPRNANPNDFLCIRDDYCHSMPAVAPLQIIPT